MSYELPWTGSEQRHWQSSACLVRSAYFKCFYRDSDIPQGMRDTMSRKTLLACLLGLISVAHSGAAPAAGAANVNAFCALEAVNAFPKRLRNSQSGSSFVHDIQRLNGVARDRVVKEQVLSGNIPDFLRVLVPVTLRGTAIGDQQVNVTICVTPDYLAVGGDEDFVRVPMGLPAAAGIADAIGFLLPTTRMVDAIYAQAGLRLTPKPMPPTSEMESTSYFWRHNQTVNEQLTRSKSGRVALTAGQKKDIVLSNRLRSKPGRVAIYGWHRENGAPIQPLSTVHGAQYADYSHGVRLVSSRAYINGEPRNLADILQDPVLAPIVSSEGAIPAPEKLLHSLR
jgi:hypothetical protein